jgi:non-specific serine/threonine protein kinase
MLALYRSGRQAEALRTYRRAADRLGEDLGIEPGPDLRRLEEMMLLQDPALDLGDIGTLAGTPAGLPEGLVTLLVTEVRIEIDDDSQDAAVALAAAAVVAAEHGGVVFAAESESFAAVFAEPAPATACALAIAVEASPEPPLPAIGIHVASMRMHGDEYVGLGLSRARRIAMSAGPGTIVVSKQCATQAAEGVPDAEFLDQGLVRLPGMSAPEQLFILSHPGLPETTTTLRLPRATNLPAQVATFVGREKDIAAVSRLVREHRLVTLTGPGGVGKTSLSRQVAADAVGAFRGGVWFVELGSLDDATLIGQTVASALGIEVSADEPAEGLVLRHLQSAETLLVFDNCEHLIDESAQLVASWLTEATGLHVLATSREALAVAGERHYPVPAMAVPSPVDIDDLDQLAEVEAVALLLSRVGSVDPEFELTAENARDVAAICRRLDGIPLAIELAASRFAALPPSDVAARLADRFAFLVSKQRGLPTRQRTLEAALDWSYDLLTEPERHLFGQLSVFRGGFDLPAVETICRDGGDVLEDLESLVSKSLVIADTNHPTPRFNMLESIHEYAQRRCDDSVHLVAAHAAYFAERVEHLGPEVWGAEGADVVASLNRDIDNIRHALAWFLGEDPAAGLTLVAAVATFWQATGLVDEGLRWTETMVQAYAGEPDLRLANAMNAAGVLRYYHGDEASTVAWWDQSLELAERFDDAATAARIASNLGVIATDAARYEDAVQYLTRAIAGFTAINDELRVAVVTGNLGVVRLAQGDLATARVDFESHLAMSRRLQSPREESRALHNYGDVLRYQGETAQAEIALRDAVALSRASNQDDYVPAALHSLAALLVETGQVDEAASCAAEGLELAISADPPAVPDCLEVLAQVAIARGHLEDAAFLIGIAHEQRGDWHAKVPPSEIAARKRREDHARTELGAQYDAALARGADATPDEAHALVAGWSTEQS